MNAFLSVINESAHEILVLVQKASRDSSEDTISPVLSLLAYKEYES